MIYSSHVASYGLDILPDVPRQVVCMVYTEMNKTLKQLSKKDCCFGRAS